MNRDPLLVIAEALGVPGIVLSGQGKTNVKDLKLSINAALVRPEYLYKESFQKFIVYPRFHPAIPKTSADKTEQDSLQGKSEELAPTGYVSI